MHGFFGISLPTTGVSHLFACDRPQVTSPKKPLRFPFCHAPPLTLGSGWNAFNPVQTLKEGKDDGKKV
jgi:hypothetical protein